MSELIGRKLTEGLLYSATILLQIDVCLLKWKSKNFFNVCLIFGGTSGKEFACQCRKCKKHRFNPWVGKIPWRRAWQPTSVFLPGEFHGERSLAGDSPWGCKESDTTEKLSVFFKKRNIYSFWCILVYLLVYLLYTFHIWDSLCDIFPQFTRLTSISSKTIGLE